MTELQIKTMREDLQRLSKHMQKTNLNFAFLCGTDDSVEFILSMLDQKEVVDKLLEIGP